MTLVWTRRRVSVCRSSAISGRCDAWKEQCLSLSDSQDAEQSFSIATTDDQNPQGNQSGFSKGVRFANHEWFVFKRFWSWNSLRCVLVFCCQFISLEGRLGSLLSINFVFGYLSVSVSVYFWCSWEAENERQRSCSIFSLDVRFRACLFVSLDKVVCMCQCLFSCTVVSVPLFCVCTCILLNQTSFSIVNYMS